MFIHSPTSGTHQGLAKKVGPDLNEPRRGLVGIDVFESAWRGIRPSPPDDELGHDLVESIVRDLTRAV